MKHEVDLKNFSLHTDLLIDEVENIEEDIITKENRKINNVEIDVIKVKEDNLVKRKGTYTTISFEDITDFKNFNIVEKIFIDELNKIINEQNLNKDYKVLVIGLGNRNSTPDSLGVKVCDNILVTRHIDRLDNLGEDYHSVAAFTPNVMGNTGLDAQDIIKGILTETKFDLLIIVDALASSKIERVNKTIQLTDTGIYPGSGVGNHRKEISKNTMEIPVIAIGVPTVVDAVTIVSDTINLLIKKIEYLKNNNPKEKLKAKDKINYLKEERVNISNEEKNHLLGLIGELNDQELKSFISEILTPIGYNMMVTPKEIDFIIEKLSLLISKGINKSIHNLKDKI
ncbi:MAG: GPR endopeptidase [Bacilli bacterium]|nr:GPR endopeptidase [Bacilli bacterium]